jgi:hypothetical protein
MVTRSIIVIFGQLGLIIIGAFSHFVLRNLYFLDTNYKILTWALKKSEKLDEWINNE